MVESELPPGELSDFSYLLRDQYEQQLKALLQQSKRITSASLATMDPQQTYLLPYTREEWKTLAKSLQLYGAQPRTTHRGLVVTRHPQSKATLILVDRRQAAGILPEADQMHAPPDLRIG